MKLLKSILAALLAVLCAPAGSAEGLMRGPVNDLALIYQGGLFRIDWTPEEIAPYVTHRFADGSESWLFDGFLFLEFSDGRGRQFAPGYNPGNARRTEWEWYIGRLFEQGKALHALDRVIGEKKDSLGDPGFRHQVVLTLPTPIPDQKDWGSIGGRELDFSNQDDQLAAVEWFIDTVARRFGQENFRNIDLHGYYWVDEDRKATKYLTARIAPLVHAQKKLFYWIPYFGAPGHNEWKELGFDMAYLQPNFFFRPQLPVSRLDDTVNIARSHDMGLEFECDERALSDSDPCYASRMTAYIDAYRRRGVFAEASIAYYTGNHLLLDMARRPSPSNTALSDFLASFIVERRATLPKFKKKNLKSKKL